MVADQAGSAAKATSRIFDHREGFGQETVERFAFFVPAAKFGGFATELIVGQLLVSCLVGINLLYDGFALTEEPPIVVTREELEDTEKHGAGRER